MSAMTAAGLLQIVGRGEDSCHQFKAVIPGPTSATAQVTGAVERLLRAVAGEMSRQQIQSALGLKGEDHFRKAYLLPALGSGLVEMPLSW